MLIRFAMRFDSAKNAAMAPMSQMSSFVEAVAAQRREIVVVDIGAVHRHFQANASIAFCRGEMSALR